MEHLTTLWGVSQFLPGVFVGVGALLVGSLDRLEVRLLSCRLSLLVGCVRFGLCGSDCMLDDVSVICFWALATGDVEGVAVVSNLCFSC